mgnify:CR=1 FL=1
MGQQQSNPQSEEIRSFFKNFSNKNSRILLKAAREVLIRDGRGITYHKSTEKRGEYERHVGHFTTVYGVFFDCQDEYDDDDKINPRFLIAKKKQCTSGEIWVHGRDIRVISKNFHHREYDDFYLTLEQYLLRKDFDLFYAIKQKYENIMTTEAALIRKKFPAPARERINTFLRADPSGLDPHFFRQASKTKKSYRASTRKRARSYKRKRSSKLRFR